MADAGEWQKLIQRAASGRPAPVRAETYLKSWQTASQPVLVRTAGADYVIKGAHVGRMVVNDQIVGRLGMALGAPVGQVCLVEVPAELISIEPAMRHFGPGIAHASLFLGGCSERASFEHASVKENRERFALLAVLYGWIGAQDHQFIYENALPHLVYSVDHGHFFPGGPNWTSTNLAANPKPQTDPSIVSSCGLAAADFTAPAKALGAIRNEVIASVVATPPDEWAFDMTDRVALAMYLEQRRDTFATELLSSQH